MLDLYISLSPAMVHSMRYKLLILSDCLSDIFIFLGYITSFDCTLL